MTKKVAQFHELIAVEADLKESATQMMADALNTFSKKPDHFKGHVKSTVYFDSARENENTTDEKALVTTVDDKLNYALSFLGKYYDALLQKEATNQVASADLVVDGVTIAENVPSTFLLGMENRLKNLRDVLIAIPTLEPNMTWDLDQSADRAGIYKSPPVVQMKSELTHSYKVLYEATEHHPANIKELTEQKPVARMETVHTSGMWTPHRKANAIARLDKMLRAVKRARQQANTAEIQRRTISDQMFAYVLGG